MGERRRGGGGGGGRGGEEEEERWKKRFKDEAETGWDYYNKLLVYY